MLIVADDTYKIVDLIRAVLPSFMPNHFKRNSSGHSAHAGYAIRDIAHLGQVELQADKFDASRDFFTRVYGLTLTKQVGESCYLPPFDD